MALIDSAFFYERKKPMKDKQYIDIFERIAEPNEIIIGSLGQGKSFTLDDYANSNERFSNSSSEILLSTSKDA